MKKAAKIIVGLLVVVMMATSLVACGGGDPGPSQKAVDPNKTQLYVGIYNGGLGTDWLYSLGDAFEAKYANVSFEEGKTGVQIFIDANKSQYEGTNLKIALQNNTERADIYFSDNINYKEFVTTDLLLEVTDAATANVYDANGELVGGGALNENKQIEATGTQSIISRAEENLADYLNFNGTGKYYAIPYFAAVTGFVYDRDLFEEVGVLHKSAGVDGEEDTDDDDWGPDGTPNTYDDGCPVTMEEFETLLNDLVKRDIIPLTWTGMNNWYTNFITQGFYAQYEGLSNYYIGKSFDGYDTDLGKQITPATGYEIVNRTGIEETYEFAKLLASKNTYYSANALKSSQTHLAAQDEFITSCKTKSIGMIVEGAWWENEARGTFVEMGTKFGSQYAYGQRDFRFMPFPTVEGQIGTKSVYYSQSGGTCVFIKKQAAQPALAKLFMQFTTSTENLRYMTKITGTPRPYDYDLTDGDLAEMTKFAKSCWELYHNENVEIAYDLKLSDMIVYSNVIPGLEGTDAGIGKLGTAFVDFINYGSDGLTVERYVAAAKANCTQAAYTAEYNRIYKVE